MPLEKTFWAARFGMVVDRFGIPWLINCDGSVVGFFEPDHKWTLEGLTNPELNGSSRTLAAVLGHSSGRFSDCECCAFAFT
jgi:hypothetical protein